MTYTNDTLPGDPFSMVAYTQYKLVLSTLFCASLRRRSGVWLSKHASRWLRISTCLMLQVNRSIPAHNNVANMWILLQRLSLFNIGTDL